MRILIIIVLLFSYSKAWSCSCAHSQTKDKSNLEFEIAQSDWIGIGTINKANRESYPATYEFAISVLFKGTKEIRLIKTGLGGPDCGFVFEVGEEYLIYGNNSDDKTIETNRCRRTNKIQDTADFDYLNKEFKDHKIKLDWSESFTNFIQSKLKSQIDLMNPPILVNKNYQRQSVKNVIEQHPNYIEFEKMNFNSGDLKKMKPKLRDLAITNGVVILKSYGQKIKKRKLIRKLNRQIK